MALSDVILRCFLKWKGMTWWAMSLQKSHLKIKLIPYSLLCEEHCSSCIYKDFTLGHQLLHWLPLQTHFLTYSFPKLCKVSHQTHWVHLSLSALVHSAATSGNTFLFLFAWSYFVILQESAQISPPLETCRDFFLDSGSDILLWFLRTLCSSLTHSLNCKHDHPQS